MAILTDTIGDITRLREIVSVFTRYGFGWFFERINLGRFVPGRGGEERPRDVAHEAQQLLLAIEELGPTFIKFGQIMSTRGDVLPKEYIEALQTLQDNVPPIPFQAVTETVEKEFGRRVDDLFDRFDPEPLASASIGQVHVAYLQDGRKLAVKIQRPGIDERVRADVSLFYGVARLIEAFIDLDIGYTPTEIVRDFDEAMQKELDFRLEARNARQFAANFREKPYIRFPEIVESHSGQRVLTMGFLDGMKIREAYTWAPEKRKLLCDRVVESGVQMILIDGFFHGDPHPGNIFVTKDCDIVFLDVGLSGTVPRYLSEALLQIVLAITLKDAGSAARIVYRIGIADERVNLAELKQDIQVLFDRYLVENWGEISAGDMLAELMERGSKHGIKHPPELATLAKTLLNIEGVVRSLYPELDFIEAVKPHAKQYFSEKVSLDRLGPELGKKASEILGLMQDLPLQMTQLMMDLEKGRVNVVVSSPDIRSLQAALRSLAVTLFLGLVTGALLLGGFSALSGALIGPPGTIVAAVAFTLSLVTGALAFGWHMIAIRMRRPKLTDLLRLKKRG